MSVNLSIIIINYNTPVLTKECIQSILKETKDCSFEIIVVDNDSKNFNGADFLELSPLVRVFENEKNEGFGIANNIGMHHANGEYILLLNSDTLIINNGIDKSLRYIRENAKVDVLTCQQLNEEQKEIVPADFYFKTNSILQYLIQSPILGLIKDKLSKTKRLTLSKNTFVENLSGAFMLFKKEVYSTTKGFDPDFFIYYEETEWCMRIKKKFSLFFLKDVSFIHLHGKSSPRLVMQKQMHLSGGLFWYKKGILSYFLFLVFTYFVYLPSWLLLTLISLKTESRKHFFKYVKIYLNLLPYFLFEIPRHKNRYNGRLESLKLKELNSSLKTITSI